MGCREISLPGSVPPNPLVGVWQLVAIAARHADGTIAPEVYGAHPVGCLTYTADGYMMVMFAQGNRSPLSGQPQSPFDLGAVPVEELAQAFASFSAYAGTYTLDGNRVYHHLTIASIPNRVGTTLVRTFAVGGSALSEPLGTCLTLTTPESMVSGIKTVFELVWERR